MKTKEEILATPRSKIRYLLYRLRNASERGEEIESLKDLKGYFEKQKGFKGWNGFARTWDVDEEGKHHRIVKRALSEEEEWNQVLEREVKELPIQWELK